MQPYSMYGYVQPYCNCARQLFFSLSSFLVEIVDINTDFDKTAAVHLTHLPVKFHRLISVLLQPRKIEKKKKKKECKMAR